RLHNMQQRACKIRVAGKVVFPDIGTGKTMGSLRSDLDLEPGRRDVIHRQNAWAELQRRGCRAIQAGSRTSPVRASAVISARSVSVKRRPRIFSIAPTRSRNTLRFSGARSAAALMTVLNWGLFREIIVKARLS